MRKVICEFCGEIIKSLAQADKPCEERDVTKSSHSIRPEDRAYLEQQAVTPKDVDPAKMRYIESRARAIAKLLDTQVHASTTEHYGFALLIFSFAGPELTYISNAERGDMKKALRELLEKWEAEEWTDFPGGIDARN